MCKYYTKESKHDWEYRLEKWAADLLCAQLVEKKEELLVTEYNPQPCKEK